KGQASASLPKADPPALHCFNATLGSQPSSGKARSQAKQEAERLKLKRGCPAGWRRQAINAFLLLSNITTPSRLKFFKGVGWK
ncbi:hypothetical protein, partial [Pseudomonas savastanoi]